MSDLLRHIRVCNNVVLPGHYRRLTLDGLPIGWVTPKTAEVLAPVACVNGAGDVGMPDAVALARVARDLADRGALRWRDEAFDIRSDVDGTVIGRLDRGAFPVFGMQAHHAHLNGLVRRGGELHVWVARRAAHKELGPGKLDHIAAGGIPAGTTPRETLIKEAAEEAGIPAALAGTAEPTVVLAYATQHADGLRRETMHCFDLELPDAFKPVAVDGEVAGFELWPLAQVLDTVRRTDAFMYDVNLALIDLALRVGCVPPDEARVLRAALNGLSAGKVLPTFPDGR